MARLNTLSWAQLQGMANSSLARLSFFVPFLPFIIGLLDSLVASAGLMQSGVEFGESQLGQEGRPISQHLDPLIAWIDENKSAVVSFYIGVCTFIVARILVITLGPRIVPEEIALRRSEIAVSISDVHSRLENEGRAHEFLEIAQHNFKLAHGAGSNEHEFFDNGDHYKRLVATYLFVFSYFLILTPAILKFFGILIFDFIF